MNAFRKYWAALPALALLIAAVWWIGTSSPPPAEITAPSVAETIPSIMPPNAPSAPSDGEPVERIETPDETPEISREERMKEIDRTHLRELHKGLFEYMKVHGHFPEYLSQLVPDFVSASALDSPRTSKDGLNGILDRDHLDPGKEQPSFGYEFSNLEFRDGRSFAEIKEVQRSEWGDAIPILRAFGYDKVINISYAGDIYETRLDWEWDPATLDVVAARGWGPGLSGGQFTEVRVLGAGGQPLQNASVWADGRSYSFDLPERPYATDANGIARIPLGTDINRTDLVLRVEGNGLASQAIAFPRGEPPPNYDLTAAPARTVGGQVLDASGDPVASTWVYLKRAEDGERPVSLGIVKTDANGHWQANMHPDDAAGFNLAVGTGRRPPKFSDGQPVDATAAGARTAVTVLPGKAGK